MNFTIEPESFSTAAIGILSNVPFASRSSKSALYALIGSDYSTASGFDQLGTIHGLSLNSTPGSAERVLRQVADELEALAANLVTTRNAYQEQDTLLARILRRADTGDSGAACLGAFRTGGLSNIAGMHRQEVFVTPAASLDALIAALATTNAAAVHQSLPIWAEITAAAANIGGALVEISSYIGANNYGDTTDAIITRLQRSAKASETIAANATHFETTLAELEPTRVANLAGAQALKAELDALAATGPEAAGVVEMIERVALAEIAVTTQAALTAITPRVLSLTDPVLAVMAEPVVSRTSAEGAGVGFDGTRFIAPQGVVDTVLGFAHAHPEKVAGVNAVTRELARQAGFDAQVGLIAPESIATSASTAGVWSPPSPVTTLGGGHGGGVSSGLAALTSGIPQVGGPLTQGTGVIGRGVNRVGRRHTTGGVVGGAWSPPPSRAGAGGHLGSDGVAGVSAPRHGYGADAPRVSRTPGAFNSPGTPSSPNTPGTPGGPGATPSAAQPSSSLSSSQGVPVGAGAGSGRGQGRKKRPPKIMITEVERDANRLALLGEPRKVLPGVIGEWIYEDPDDPNGTYPNKI
ncbi:hypothetical protein [Corynebacterium uterequi]|uniref:Uncharacterized protein n=1 Tax=Corynebacterium uterequi TaxID=1072256 RepID=A0A0G3HDI6_9CORY|nr:hypothetical protein [Corynebacterium uterequi]AKK11374.1 hypothetical protein CUTER_06925 [Corynebacterium uterequi]